MPDTRPGQKSFARYAVFAWYTYYPCGGFNDFRESFDTLDDAKSYVFHVLSDSELGDFEHYEIIDLESGESLDKGRIKNN